ncbi:hypothetical protein LSCM1_04195 [Leishmania martiniquensis]|uniref:C2H2-type domain-containing protein n=1 Tax=Leishmania martiniquensis TaxID=1580590 RepID=A0A836KSD2_9TRYP|nr:hypothetical protein LSCM1_04195 [Leishmania martiniquensis]
MSASGVSHSRSAAGAAVGFTVHLVCPHCAKVFTGNSSTSGVRSNYRRHLLTHTGERPFPCTYCHQRFTTKPNLRRHVRLIHPLQATPSTQIRRPNSRESDKEGAAAPPPLPEMRLPPATTANVAELTSADSATAAAGLSSGPCCSPLPPQPAVTAAFTCADCELEMSSRARLRRHRRYFCPFRENIFADPVQDAVNLYRAHHQQQQRERDGDGGDSAEGDSCDDGGYGVPSVDERVELRGRATVGPLALTEAEKNYLADVAGRSGLKFVEDAYASDGSGNGGPDSDVFSDTSSSSTSSRFPYWTEMHPSAPLRPRSSGRVGGALPPPKRTPLHGRIPSPSSSPHRRVLRSPETAAVSLIDSSSTSALAHHAGQNGCLPSVDSDTQRGEGTAAEEASEDEDEDEDMISLVHLHHHRRGSGRRRERHILQKRLRAQEGALMALAADSTHRPPCKARAGEVDAVKHGSDTAVGEAKAKATRLRVAPPIDKAHSAAAPPAAYAYVGPSQSLLTPHVVAQAESLVVVNWRHPRRGKNGTANAFVCPYCDEYATFTSQRGLRAHATRAHPEAVAKARMRVVERGGTGRRA